ncbi:MAG: sulfate adenylyltransferase subunit CysD [Gammaproteobacteria bacterium]
MKSYKLTHLQLLESEAIYIMREVAAMFERPVLLFSGGKDSICLVRLAQRAFAPGRIPFPLMHVDTGHNFPEAIEFRDRLVQQVGAKLIVKTVQESIDKGRVTEEKGPNASRNALQTVTLLDAIEEFKFDACFGGARRDEEKARAKERVFSHRNEFGQWDPKNQRPELWNLYNARKNVGEHFRVFPLSNWTELDVWQYILREQLEIPSIYFTHKREVVDRKGMLLAKSDFISLLKGEHYEEMQIRFRTVGDMTCTGAVVSNANSVEDIIREIASARVTERGGRSDDKRSDSAMEDRKLQGYF